MTGLGAPRRWRPAPRALVVGLGVTALLVGSGIAYAAIPGVNGVITGATPRESGPFGSSTRRRPSARQPRSS